MLMIANWKMNMTKGEISAFLDCLAGEDRWRVWRDKGVRLVLCPSYPYLEFLGDQCKSRNLPFGIMAQNMCAFEKGAYTGEVSAAMLKDLAVEGVLLGHSERRQYFGETDGTVAEKVTRALSAGLLPVVCFGETRQERESGNCQTVWSRQVGPVWERVQKSREAGIRIPVYWAYEPVWAIGTGQTAGLPEIREVSSHLLKTFGPDCASGLLYGGSVNDESVSGLFEKGTLHGFLVGTAFLDGGNVLRVFDRLFGRP